MKTAKTIFPVVLLLMPISMFCFQDGAHVLPQGMIATNDPSRLPLPASGYQIYLVGEAHGNQQTKAVLMGYLGRLYSESSLRDIFLEEDQAYEEEAQSFVTGKQDNLPEGLCLRADILNCLREFNRGLPLDKKIRVHLVDVDSPEPTIRQHLVRLINKIGTSAENIKIPDERLSLAGTGSIIERLAQLTSDRDILSGLRTVKQSLILYDSGLRIHTGATEGNPLDPVREEAITANLLDVLYAVQPGSLLGLYGAAHVPKGTRTFQDPKKGTLHFTPLSGRLERFGVSVYRTICYPLAGAGIWRQQSFKLPVGPAASDFRLSSGETMQDVLGSAPDSEFFYMDLAKDVPPGIRIQAPLRGDSPISYEKAMEAIAQFRIRTQSMTPGTIAENPSEQFDSIIFLREATPMKDQCPSMNK
jgi:hypothetical protein